jgi:hypothetical protein
MARKEETKEEERKKRRHPQLPKNGNLHTHKKGIFFIFYFYG